MLNICGSVTYFYLNANSERIRTFFADVWARVCYLHRNTCCFSLQCARLTVFLVSFLIFIFLCLSETSSYTQLVMQGESLDYCPCKKGVLVAKLLVHQSLLTKVGDSNSAGGTPVSQLQVDIGTQFVLKLGKERCAERSRKLQAQTSYLPGNSVTQQGLHFFLLLHTPGPWADKRIRTRFRQPDWYFTYSNICLFSNLSRHGRYLRGRNLTVVFNYTQVDFHFRLINVL